MTRKQKLTSTIAALTLTAAAAIGAAQVDVSARRHPNLNAAQRQIEAAIGRLDAAQHSNEFDMNGHAQHAKELLTQADNEIKEAAIAANHH